MLGGGEGCQTVTCRFMCSERWSDREKARSHSRHWNGLSPVCLRKCRVNSSLRANFQSQSFHVHWNGFSPVWVRWCALRWEDLVYTLVQPGYLQAWAVFLRRPLPGFARFLVSSAGGGS